MILGMLLEMVWGQGTEKAHPRPRADSLYPEVGLAPVLVGLARVVT